jgi:hypothetical protein
VNLPAVKEYAAELGALIDRVDHGQHSIAQMKALMRAADQAGEREQQLRLAQQKANAEKQLEQLMAALRSHARRDDLEAARTLHFDIAARIDLALEEYLRWRRALAEFEFDASEDRFLPAEDAEPGPGQLRVTRAAAETGLDRHKRLAERRVEHAAALVPERPVVLV